MSMKFKGVFDESETYRPFASFGEVFAEFRLKQQKMHWIETESQTRQDVEDYATKVTPQEKELLGFIFMLFTQGDMGVASMWLDIFGRVFKNNEIRNMCTTFASVEATHQAAYDLINRTLGIPESKYQEFKNYVELVKKWEFIKELNSINVENFLPTGENIHKLLVALAICGGFVEGLQLYGSFTMLLWFGQVNLMPAMTEQVSWSVRDEALHVVGAHTLFMTVYKEFKDMVDLELLQSDIKRLGIVAVDNEISSIDLSFGEFDEVRGLSKQSVKDFMKYLADIRFSSFGIGPIYGIKKNPCPWFDEVVGLQEHANFFEVTATSYSKGNIKFDVNTEEDYQSTFIKKN